MQIWNKETLHKKNWLVLHSLQLSLYQVSTVLNCVLCIMGGVIVFCIICVGFFHVNHENWTGDESFFKFGVQGVSVKIKLSRTILMSKISPQLSLV